MWPTGPTMFTDLSFAKKLDPCSSSSYEHQGKRCADTPRWPCCWGETGQTEPAYSPHWEGELLSNPRFGASVLRPRALLTRVCLTRGECGWQLQVKPWLWPLPSSEFFFSSTRFLLPFHPRLSHSICIFKTPSQVKLKQISHPKLQP